MGLNKNFIVKEKGLIIYGNPDNPDYKAINQVYNVKKSKLFGNNLIAVMPDYHIGSGCTIGFTSKLGDLICPNIIGVDLGCSVISAPVYLNLYDSKIDLNTLHESILKFVDVGNGQYKENKDREISTNFIMNELYPGFKDEFYNHYSGMNDFERYKNQLGSLGGGNHFIEFGISKTSIKSTKFHLTVHTGSRRLGHDIATYYQRKALKLCRSMKVGIEKSLAYFPTDSELGDRYLNELKIAQDYAKVNRTSIIHQVLNIFSKLNLISEDSIMESINNSIESVHNYIEFNSEFGNIVRKGAISAYKDEQVLIPLSMGDGVIIGTGKGNKNWNYSAPHGAGRISSRMEVKRKVNSGELKIEDIEERLDGVVTNNIEEIKDEIPQAYKNPDDIIPYIDETVSINEIIRPILNVKG